MNLVLENLKRKDEQGIWYYDLHDDRHGMLLLEDMEHAMTNNHVSRHTLVFTSKDEYSTLLNYLHEYKYDKRLVRERIRSCARRGNGNRFLDKGGTQWILPFLV